jgi:hypothetical protein
MTPITRTTPAGRVASHPKLSALVRQAAAFRLIPAIDTYPRIVALAQTKLGKGLLLSLFAAALRLRFEPILCLAMTTILAATTFLPNHRRWIVTGGTLLWLARFPFWFDWAVPQYVAQTHGVAGAFNFSFLRAVALAAVFIFSVLLIHLASRYPGALPFRRPVLTLALLYAVLLMFASVILSGKIDVIAWSFVATLGAYFWFLAYALIDARAKDGDSAGLQLGAFHPFWGSSTTPLPKGASYLRRIECKEARGLAITQLKAFKLLAWACILNIAADLFAKIAHMTLAIPSFQAAFNSVVVGAPLPWYVCWLALITAFAEEVLNLSVWGHTIIACCRMAGFCALRNTYKPLEAKTIAEFWNRYYFYFKELLVDFFFYPTFFRYFKRRKRLRIAAATFMAAGLGNMFFHFIRDIRFVAQLGLWRAVMGFHVYAFYCFGLSAGIVASQLRSRKHRRSSHWFWVTVSPRFGVLLFYSLLMIFGDTERTYPLSLHLAFFLRLFGIRI